MQFRPWRLITATIQPRYSRDSGRYSRDTAAILPRFRTCTSSSDDPYSPIRLLFQLPTPLSLAGRSPGLLADGAGVELRRRADPDEHPDPVVPGPRPRDVLAEPDLHLLRDLRAVFWWPGRPMREGGGPGQIKPHLTFSDN